MDSNQIYNINRRVKEKIEKANTTAQLNP